MKDHSTAYAEWLAKVNDAIVASGGRSLFSMSKKPLPVVNGGEDAGEPGDLTAAEVEAICDKAGIKPFRYYR